MLQAMAEIHGEVVNEQYTGNYDRRCWSLDPLESGSWASPIIGQHELYLPEYFKTHNNVSDGCSLLHQTNRSILMRSTRLFLWANTHRTRMLGLPRPLSQESAAVCS